MDVQSEKYKISVIRLIRSENVGPRTFKELMHVYGCPDRAIDHLQELSRQGGRKRKVRLCSVAQVEQEMQACKKYGAHIITLCDSSYPKLLTHIYDAPPVLTILGNCEILNEATIAIVGARNASANGCKFSYNLGRDLGDRGFIVASGLARGIDTAAHHGALMTGTVSVVAGGIDKIYPPENKELMHKITEQGVVMAEMPFGTTPKAQNFPKRNRIISGISLGVVVVEASLNSGSLITARMATEQDREVFAVPGSPLDPRCRGTNQLIKQGAQLIDCADDIIANISHFRNMTNGNLSEDAPIYTASPAEGLDQISNVERKEVVQKLSAEPVCVDEIIIQTGLAANIVLVVLLELELAGNLTRYSGNKVAMNNLDCLIQA